MYFNHCKHRFIQDFIIRGGGKRKYQPVLLSQMLLCVVKMHSFFIKCIDEKTKWLSSMTCQNYRGGGGGKSQVPPPPVWIPAISISYLHASWHRPFLSMQRGVARISTPPLFNTVYQEIFMSLNFRENGNFNNYYFVKIMRGQHKKAWHGNTFVKFNFVTEQNL